MSEQRGWAMSDRLGGLRRFAIAITLFNVLGHVFLGFEQSWLQPLVALGTAYALELLLELVDARANGRTPRFSGGPGRLIDFLLSAHISALAVSMLLYSNDRLAVIAFATAVAIGSKTLIRLRLGSGTRHVFNPSNLGITITLLLFPWVGIAPPYHFTENLASAGNWVLPAIIVASGSFLNARYTRRIPLLLAWVVGFFLQAVIRTAVTGAPLTANLVPMSGVAFVLFTFYMVTDPATTPRSLRGQVIFGGAVAAMYGLLLFMHIVFGFFFALSIVCAGRCGLLLLDQVRAASPLVAAAPAARGGVACRYPDARTPAELWENVLARRRAFRAIPAERLNPDDYVDPDRSAIDRTYVGQAAVIEGYEFDRVAYRVAGSTYRSVDLAQWLALDVAAAALGDTGIDPDDLPKRSTGVVLGNTLTGEFSRANVMRLRWPYVRRVLDAMLVERQWTAADRSDLLAAMEARYKAPFPPVGEETLAGGLSNTIAGRICNHFDFKGGGYTVDGACASSLLAVTTACTNLLAGDLDVAIAGGVDLSLDPFEIVGFARTGALAPELMRVYDKRSAGFWPGEGCGFIVLMREEAAVERGLRIYATIRGWGVSSDGGGGITRPTIDGQLLAVHRAYERAGFGIDTVGCFEGHGTGTAVGDANELRVLSTALGEAGRREPAPIGSIKANIGHTKAAAGIAGLIKATLAVHHQLLPPTTGCEDEHAELCGSGAMLRVLHEARPWTGDAPRRAAISAMGFGGINTHAVIEGAAAPRRTGLTPGERRWAGPAQDAELFLLAGPSVDAVREQVTQLLLFAGRLSMAELTDLAAVLQQQLDGGDVRAAVIAAAPNELVERLSRLQELLRNASPRCIDAAGGVFVAACATAPRVGFVFTGQGSTVYRDGGALARRFAAVTGVHDGLDLPAGDGVSTAVAQPAIAASSLVGLRALGHLGISADVGLGHSLGELTALHWAGAYDEAALLRITAARGRAMTELGAATGAMASLSADADAVGAMISDLDLVISGYNSPRRTVVSGDADAVETVITRAREAGIAAARLPVSHAFHSRLVADAVPALREHLATERLSAMQRPIMSTVSGGPLEPDADLAELLAEQVLRPVRFEQAARAAADRVDLLIEVGPGTVLSRLLGETIDTPAIALDAGGRSLRGLLGAVAAAHALGSSPRCERLFEDRFHRPIDLDWNGRFFANPCEDAPRGADDLRQPMHEDERADDAPIDLAADATPAETLRELLAVRAELPAASIRDDDRFLSDLHLNSITVGQVIADAARRLGLPAPAAPTEYADATIAEAAAALDQLRQAPDTAREPETVPAGVDTWVGAFTIELEECPQRNGRPQRGTSTWQVFAPAGDRRAAEIQTALSGAVEGDGVLVYLPTGADARHIDLLLQAGHAALRHREGGRFVLVQSRGGAASFGRTLHMEAPGIATTVIDVAPDAPGLLEQVVAEVGLTTDYHEVRIDGAGRRYRTVLRPLEGEQTDEVPLNDRDVLLVTGGGKGIAAECARAIAEACGVRLALIGRSDPADDETLAANLRRLRDADVRFGYRSADVCDAAAVQRAVAELADELGAVSAVLHGAGANVPKLIGALDSPSFRRTVAPKVTGLRNVLAAVRPEQLRLLVGFGSIIARMGLEGEADYAVANEWLTREIEQFGAEHPRCRCLCMESSVWSGVGMGQRLGRVDELLRRGVTSIGPTEGIAWLLKLVRQPTPVAVVVTGRYGDPPTLRIAGRPLPLMRFLETPRVHYPGRELVVDCTISVDRDPYVTDHALGGERLFPAVFGLEAMAQAAMATIESPAPPVFTDVQLRRPIIIPETGSVTLRVAALRRDDGAVDVVVRSEETGFQADHFAATCFIDGHAGDEAVDLEHIVPTEIPTSVDVDPGADLYGSMLFQAGRFRRVAGYRRLSARCCSALLRPDEGPSWFAGYLPEQLVLGDPGRRDATMHAIQACIPHARVLPVSVERIVPGDARGGACVVHAVERQRDAGSFVYDVVVVDERGSVIERWSGLRLQRVEPVSRPPIWNGAVLGAYIERRADELLRGGAPRVGLQSNGAEGRDTRRQHAVEQALGEPARLARRPDGRPELRNGEPSISMSHCEDMTLAVAGRGAVGCDLERVLPRGLDVWSSMLSADRLALVELLHGDREDADTAATRVWAAQECLRKIEAPPDAPLTLDGQETDGWIVFRSGGVSILTYAAPVRGSQGELVIAVLAEVAAHAG